MTGHICRPTAFEADEALSEGIKIKWLATTKEIVGPELTVDKMELDARDHRQPPGWFDTQQLRQPIDGEGVPEVLALKAGAGPRPRGIDRLKSWPRSSRYAIMRRYPRASVLDNKRASLLAWQDRVRDPSLTVLLVLQLFLMFLALPLAATGMLITERVALLLLLVVLTVVVLLSHRGVAIVMILLGLAAVIAPIVLGREWSPIIANMLSHGGLMLVFSALTWVVAHAVYAPGRITFHRLQGAAVVYLSVATIFAIAFSLMWELIPGAFANLPTPVRGPHEFATMFYFSLATLTTTGYGDIVPLNPFARSLANLEEVLGQFYLAITIARLVTLELADRRQR